MTLLDKEVAFAERATARQELMRCAGAADLASHELALEGVWGGASGF